MTKERPILFNAPMVRAILDGRKTQTRRIIKPQPNRTTSLNGVITSIARDGFGPIKHPYGAVGGKLWVRESYQVIDDNVDPHDVRMNNNVVTTYLPSTNSQNCISLTCKQAEDFNERRNYHYNFNIKPSIHMPRWASSINLLITDIRVERLQDISEEDAIAEGFSPITRDLKKPKFQALWESINGAGSWDLNQYVWVIEFELIRR